MNLQMPRVGWVEEVVWEFGIDMYTLLYLKWIIIKDLLYSRGKSADCYVTAWIGQVVWERRDTCIYMAESICCPPEIITVLLIGYPPI